MKITDHFPHQLCDLTPEQVRTIVDFLLAQSPPCSFIVASPGLVGWGSHQAILFSDSAWGQVSKGKETGELSI